MKNRHVANELLYFPKKTTTYSKSHELMYYILYFTQNHPVHQLSSSNMNRGTKQ